jgi:hypothetical protein
MVESDENDHSNGDKGADYCEGDGCGTTAEELFFCSACECTFCTACWAIQVAHRTSSRRRATLRPGLKHEKTRLSTLKLVQPAFSAAKDEGELEQMMADDAEAAWFGKSCKTWSLFSDTNKTQYRCSAGSITE